MESKCRHDGRVAYNLNCMRQAFAMIDQNRDGFVDEEDLRGIYSSLGE